MKVTVLKRVEIEVSHIRISVPLHEDVIEEIGERFPLLNGGTWNATVEIGTGKIVDWPDGARVECHLRDKVRDQGTYTLLGPGGEEVAKIDEEYVPDDAIPGEYGDYIDFEIKDGTITNWYKPNRISLNEFFPDAED